MKKIFRNFMAIAIAGIAFTACEDVPAPYDVFAEEEVDPSTIIDPAGSGTQADPYNVKAILDLTNALPADQESAEGYYIKGYVVSVKEQYSTLYGNATFNIADKPDGTDVFTIYRAYYFDNKKYTSGETLNVGDEVVVYGTVINFRGKTPETQQGKAYLVSLNGKGSQGGGEQPAGEAKGTGSEADPFNVAAAIAKCKEIGTTASTEKYYVTGTVVEDATANDQFHNITFDIQDAGNNAKFKCFQVGAANTLPNGYSVKKGDVVVVYGPIYNYSGNTPETAGKGEAIIISVNGKAVSEGGSDTPQPAGEMGTANNPITVAAALTIINGLADGKTTDTEAFVKGKIKSISEISTQYGNATYIISDDGADNELTVFRGKGLDGASFTSESELKVGDEVIIKGKLQKYVKDGITTPEVATGSSIVKLNGQGGNGGEQGSEQGGETASSLTNGDFEAWADGLPTGWKSASTASSATLSQSTDAHGGSYSCNINGKESSNVRLATQEITLAAGTYTFSFWAKATVEDVSQVRPGYVAVVNGAVNGSYQYGEYATLSTGWQQVSYEFTLASETTLCLVVMNPKKSSYSSGKDVLVDDAVLTKK